MTFTCYLTTTLSKSPWRTDRGSSVKQEEHRQRIQYRRFHTNQSLQSISWNQENQSQPRHLPRTKSYSDVQTAEYYPHTQRCNVFPIKHGKYHEYTRGIRHITDRVCSSSESFGYSPRKYSCNTYVLVLGLRSVPVHKHRERHHGLWRSTTNDIWTQTYLHSQDFTPSMDVIPLATSREKENLLISIHSWMPATMY